MTDKLHVVTKCGDCHLFCEASWKGGAVCRHPELGYPSDTKTGELNENSLPPQCPLRRGPYVVTTELAAGIS